jgi:hypothetical protein
VNGGGPVPDARSPADDLVSAVSQLMARPGADQFDRANIVALLNVIADGLTPLLSEPACYLPTGEPVFHEHPAVRILSGLAAALADLDFAKTDPIFKPNEHGAGNTRRWHEREKVRVLLEAVEIFLNTGPYRTRKQAQEAVVCKLQKSELGRVGGKAITQKYLQKLRERNPL